MKTFIYNEELYIRVIPSKRLFHSTTIHEVVNRGDIFALRVRDQLLTIIPGKASVEHMEHVLAVPYSTRDFKVELREKQVELKKLMEKACWPIQTSLGFIDNDKNA